MSIDRAGERLPERISLRMLLISGAATTAVALALWLRPEWTILAGRLLASAVLGALVVYQSILAVLGFRGRLVGPRSEERIWVENASVGFALLLVAVIVWLP